MLGKLKKIDGESRVIKEPYATAVKLGVNPNSGSNRITRERVKQITEHGYTPEKDSAYGDNELLFGALAYLNAAIYGDFVGMEDWPFNNDSWKYEGKEESLVKAGAFIAAYLDAEDFKRRQQKDTDIEVVFENPEPGIISARVEET